LFFFLICQGEILNRRTWLLFSRPKRGGKKANGLREKIGRQRVVARLIYTIKTSVFETERLTKLKQKQEKIMEIILAFIAGAVLCGVAAYLKIKKLSSRLEQTVQARTQAELENARLNERIVSLGNAQAGAENFANQLLAQQDKKFAALQATAKAEFK
jgi:hypothetical protein